MPRYRLTLAYDGTDFGGWQIQPSELAERTVQGVLEEGISRLARGALVRVKGAGRTDAGVHALGQVATFDLPVEIGAPELYRALNAILPQDIRVLAADAAPEGFCPRASALSKSYRYVLDTGPIQLPERRRFVGHVPYALDEPRVREAAALFVGRHDFASLGSSGGSTVTTVRTITRSEVVFDDLPLVSGGRTLTYEVEGDGFLRKMVRSIVGGLIAAGRGAATVSDLERALAAHDRRAWPAPAAARGLTLVQVRYDAPSQESNR
jgi:tRNA pseudouridine38-40 synthase